ncbi:MAG: N-acetyl-D-Glu racemase DgcA [Candidatus Methylumidiphilus sp.]
MRQVSLREESWPLRGVFRISRGSVTAITVVVVEIREGMAVGRGECRPYSRYGETPQAVIAEIEALVPALEAGMERDELNASIAPGAVRNAIDCALWDLSAKRTGQPVWQLAGLPPPKPLSTAFTLSVDTPRNLATAAKKEAGRPLLKLKLAGGGDLDRVAAVRSNAPNARLIVDANEAWTVADYLALAPELARLGVEMLEQPFPSACDHWLATLQKPLPICADESCHAAASLKGLAGLYDAVNIKLDKAGGLTEALRMKSLAEGQGFKVMVGCMVATSLAMAPAFLLAQGAAYADIDGPLLLATDRRPGLRYDGSRVYPPSAELWG